MSKKNTDISERILFIIESEGVTINSFAKSLGYKRSQALYDITNKRAKPSFDFFEKYANSEYSETYTLDWLITGSKNANKNANKSANKGANKVDSKEIEGGKDILIESLGSEGLKVYSDAESPQNEHLKGTKVYISHEIANAGESHFYDMEGTEASEYFVLPDLGSGFFACFPVRGRSMTGTVEDGSLVVCKLLEDYHEYEPGGIYVISTRSRGIVLKRIDTYRWLDDSIIAYSDNPAHSPFLIPHEEIYKVWSVEVILQSFITEKQESLDNLKNFVSDLEVEYKAKRNSLIIENVDADFIEHEAT